MDLRALSIAEMGRALHERRVSAEQLTRAALARVDADDDRLHAFIRVEAAAALAAARAADGELAAGRDRGPLHGIPYAVKDIYDVAGLPTSCNSKIQAGHVAADDSAAVARLRAAGAVLLGKANTHEFAFGGPSFDLPFPPARNPWDPARIPGGSSSGSAAAIAAGFVRFALGSCTGGSIRGPAAWCGVVGIKPSFGRVSCRGVFPLAPSLDHCGPLARSVEDAAIVLQAIAGHDPADPASVDRPVPDFRSGLDAGVGGLRIGVPRAFFADAPALTPAVGRAIADTQARLAGAGATVEDVDLPDIALFAACARVIMTYEMYAVHKAALRARLADFGELSAHRFVLGAAIGADDYAAALRLRVRLTRSVDRVLQRCDALVSAIALATAPPFDPLPLPSTWAIQASQFNVTGHPTMTVPVGLAEDGMPLAVQVVGRPFDEATVLRIGRAIERLTGWDRVALPHPSRWSRAA